MQVLCVLALNDAGKASFDRDLARKVAGLDIPTFAATPNRLVEAVERALRGDLSRCRRRRLIRLRHPPLTDLG